jgi:hypothetical protein
VKIVAYAAAGLALLAAIVLIAGLLLPTTHVAVVESRYRASASDIHAAINDVASAQTWRSGLEQVEVLSRPGEPLMWREVADWGTLTFVHDVNEPGRRIVSRIVDEGQAFGGTWTYDIDETPGGTVLRISERGEITNPLYRFMSRFVFGYYRGLETYARDLGRRFGEDVIVERSS